MLTQWIHRINVIAPINDTNATNALWTIIAPNGDAEAQTFGAPLSVDGNEPATHLGMSTAATEIMRLLMTDTYAGELAGCVIEVRPYTEIDFPGFLAANGLQTIETELFDGA
jgi:hypothetical protein